MKKKVWILLFCIPVMYGCSAHDHEHGDHNAEQEIETVAVTQWNDAMEIFMEYETPVAGREIKFIIHLTNLADFQPVREGKVMLTFTSKDRKDITFEKRELLREGIFTPIHTFDTPAEYHFSLQYDGPKVKSDFDMGVFKVYETTDDIPVSIEDEATDAITFLKEQQWKIDFATEEVPYRKIQPAVQAVGEIRPRPASYAEIVSPVEGIISIAEASQLVKPGQRVEKGQTLAVLVPPLAAQNSWAEVYLNYEQARAEFERARRLKERNAISERDFEQARRNFDLRKAGFANYFDSDGGNVSFDAAKQQFTITAPISGIVSDVTVLPGQKVDRHQKLFSLVDPDMVWLRLDLFADQAAQLYEVSGISIKLPGTGSAVNLGHEEVSVISRGEMVDTKTRTVTLWLEAGNKNRVFMIGQTFSADIFTGAAREMLAVPLSAVYDDNLQKIVYVHTAGESFEKRELMTGPVYHDHIGILSGVSEGERVVTRGGYLVKLAATSEEIGHPHTH